MQSYRALNLCKCLIFSTFSFLPCSMLYGVSVHAHVHTYMYMYKEEMHHVYKWVAVVA